MYPARVGLYGRHLTVSRQQWRTGPGCRGAIAPWPPHLLKKGAPLVNRYNFAFCFSFIVEKQENMLGPLCVTSKNLAPIKKSYAPLHK